LTEQERKKMLSDIYNKQEQMAESLNLELEQTLSFRNFELDKLDVPIFEELSSKDISLEEIETLKNMDESVFAKWNPADIPVMFVAGIMGTFTSVQLRDYFADLHDNKFGKTGTLWGGHSGETPDVIPGATQAGGPGHRFKYGHDLLNPFEIDWSDYLEKAAQTNVKLPNWLKAYGFWLRHLLQDTFSKQGLPMPGNTVLRKWINPARPKNAEMLQIFDTLKMRDLAGAGVTNLIMGAYLWGTEKSLSKITTKPSYRTCSLMLGANMITLLSGLLIPNAGKAVKASFNWSSFNMIGYYGANLFKLEKSIRKELSERDLSLQASEAKLFANDKKIQDLIIFNDATYAKLKQDEKELFEFDKQVNFYHSIVRNQIMREEA